MLALGIFDQFLDDRYWIVRVNFIVSAIFLSVAFLIFLAIFIKRNRRKQLDKEAEIAEAEIIDLVNTFLFDEEANKKDIRVELKYRFNRPGILRRVLVDQLLNFRRNFSGEMAVCVTDLFVDVGLKNHMIDEIHSPKWHHRAHALSILADMGVLLNIEMTSPRLNDRKAEVREQALLYHLKVAEKEPLAFLDRITKPLSYWQQIYIENGLKHIYKGPDPDFSWWLDHHLDSVVIFSMKMISVYNQHEHIPKLLPFLKDDNKLKRLHSFRALYQLGYDEIFVGIQMKFKGEDEDVKKEILRGVEYIRAFELIPQLRPLIGRNEWKTKLLLSNIERKHGISSGLQLASVKLGESEPSYKGYDR